MTTNEALYYVKHGLEIQESFRDFEEEQEALSVLRAVCEDYEKARPLIQAAIDLEFSCGHFNVPMLVMLGDAALAYRNKP